MCLNKLNNYTQWGTIPLRLVLAAVFIVAGTGKLADGVTGFSGMLAGIGFPVPTVLAWIVAIVEVVAGIVILLGLLTRWASIAVGIVMLVALFTVHISQGFGGSRVALLALAGAVALFFTGGGPLSLDRLWFDREF